MQKLIGGWLGTVMTHLDGASVMQSLAVVQTDGSGVVVVVGA
jgi:hypothetical protein